MTKRYPLRGALGRRNARDSRHFQRVALGILEAAHRAQHLRLHLDEALRHRGARGDLLTRDVHHFYFAALSVMREFRHWLHSTDLRISTEFTESTEGTK